MTLDEDIEIINLPETGEFKVVQIVVDGHPVMICESNNSFHKNMLTEYLESRGISYETFTLGIKKLPYLEGEKYQVVGMGKAEIRKDIKFFQLPYGSSKDYGIGTDPDFKERLRQQFVGWEF